MRQKSTSRRVVPLNGTWELASGTDDRMPAKWPHRVPVPALVDVAEPRYQWKEVKYHWYRTQFTVAEISEAAFLVIEQAMFGTSVWLNGHAVGCDLACYTSQEYDIRPFLKQENDLIVRVGQRSDLPKTSAVGNDQERSEWIPGIWGDVYVVQTGALRIKHVQVIPHLAAGQAEVRTTLECRHATATTCLVASRVVEKKSGKQASPVVNNVVSLGPSQEAVITSLHEIDDMNLWSPDTPFLYEVLSTVSVDEAASDELRTTFGMREFKVQGSDFYLNNQKIFLKGGNVAFHRFLSDADRGTLPWDLDWVKKLLIDIPKEHNFNFFRNHIGQLYNRWYDLADEHGMLIQNEWMFWTTSGSQEQITKEFTRWLQDNWNHPSIVIWDPLNESSDPVVQNEIVPEMKKLDPTRPWESVDFLEEHPYIYSLGPVLNDRKFGFTRALSEIEASEVPTMLNEFCWWWLDKDYQPSLLTKDVVERWLGPGWTKEELIAHQGFLVQELIELFRRMRVDAIQPFVYLSNNAGPTANWFAGDIRNLEPKPLLQNVKNAFAPVGVSVELWDRHFLPNEGRTVRVFVINDLPSLQSGQLRCGLINGRGDWVFETRRSVETGPSESVIIPITLLFPEKPGDYTVFAEFVQNGNSISHSQKPCHVLAAPQPLRTLQGLTVAVLSATDELGAFLDRWGVRSVALNEENLAGCEMIVVGEGQLATPAFQKQINAVSRFVESGKTLMVIEPEFGVETEAVMHVTHSVQFTIRKRNDLDKGGYDSYVFAENIGHLLWHRLEKKHLKMFNGAYGGEVVSEHEVTANSKMTVLARCGMHLSHPAVFEMNVGEGRILVSRLQSRSRLEGQRWQGLYERRTDPVLQQFLLNAIAYATH